MRYDIVNSDSLVTLIANVNKAIREENATPTGGISIVAKEDGSGYYYVQAIIKKQ